MPDKGSNLISDRRLMRNILWNVIGTGTPLLVAIFVIPLLIDGLGVARFGVLTVAWMIVGYFSLFDLGLGRALTKLVAERIGDGNHHEIPAVVWTAMSLMMMLGVIGAIALASFAPFSSDVLNIPDELHAETVAVFFLLSASVPVVISATGLRGILEAHQRFGLVNMIRLPLGLVTFLGPWAVLPFSNSLEAVVLVLVGARIISFLAYLGICLDLFPELRQCLSMDWKMARRLFSFGGWMTVSNIVGPLLLYLGRLLIVVMISAEAVAYFATPYEVVVNLLIIPGMLVGVLFPAFTQLLQNETATAAALYSRSMLGIGVVMLPLVLVVFMFAEEGLAWWINEEFSQQGYWVAKILAIGVFLNSFGLISQALVQGYGRPDLTAKLHLAELILYVPYLWLLIEESGIDGAALAWTIRVAISTVALVYLAQRCINGSISVKY